MNAALIALHGFLGRSSDWSFFDFNHLQAIDLYALPGNGLKEWSRQINKIAERQSEPPILMGYSLGGRLGLQALVQSPYLWKGAIIISAHPGLSDPVEKHQRAILDEKWAVRFLEENWDILMSNWNQRSVFQTGNFNFQRQAKDYHRATLARWLKKRSLGFQEDLKSEISQLSIPILWICGEQDPTYLSLAHSLQFSHPHSSVVTISQAGHRAPWEQPIPFKQHVEQFLSLLSIHKNK